jgi:hypothetical protein
MSLKADPRTIKAALVAALSSASANRADQRREAP